MDPIPTGATSTMYLALPPPRRSSSLDKCCEYIGETEDCTNYFPGNGALPAADQEAPIDEEVDAEAPLLRDGVATVVKQRRLTKKDKECNESQTVTKRWRSLEAVSGGDAPTRSAATPDDRKQNIAHNSLKSWLVGLFNGNGMRASNTSLRKGVLPGYADLQVERESIV